MVQKNLVTYILNRKIVVAGLDRVAAWPTYCLDVTSYVSPYKKKARTLLYQKRQGQFVPLSTFFLPYSCPISIRRIKNIFALVK